MAIRWNGYVEIFFNGKHHRKNCRGRVMEHILVVESAMGKELKWPNRVHHINGDRSDNRNCNLVVCEDERYHRLLHTRAKSLKESGNVHNRKCKFCKQYDKIESLVSFLESTGRFAYYHAKCMAGKARERYHAKKNILQVENELQQRAVGQ